MFTKEQEDYLIKIANIGIAEDAEAEARNEQIEAERVFNELHEAKLAELTAKKQAELEEELSAYDASIKP